ncbi:AraC family transcriptional regulator [Danxiaibacter flavus]|uniref:AraC family transcriptional regulator n=1 Tax=Danxiaibacter flavus TaxID=3049108 RepID=A0ABV3ZJY8_9BACT|nr:AraC family transcriptional regulator [Chitinophagaceae bacterium DXS]
MAFSKPLQIFYKNDEHWFPQIGPQLNAVFDDTTLTFDNEIGSGRMYKAEIDAGLRLRRVELKFNREVIFIREPALRPGYFALVSNLSDQYIGTITNEHHFKLGSGTDNGIYFSSPLLAASYTFEPDTQYHLIFVVITYDRLRSFIASQSEEQKKFLYLIIDKEKPVYHFEWLDAHFLNILKDIDYQLGQRRSNNLLLHARTLELCYYMLQRVEQRHSNTSGHVHHEDIDKLNKIKSRLLEKYDQKCPSIDNAAQEAGMSPTKFKTLFKQVFGQTYYQFYKHVRMYKAKELLEQQKLNVSEVGYMLGYNNLSKFSKAFKDVFDITPGAVASQ